MASGKVIRDIMDKQEMSLARLGRKLGVSRNRAWQYVMAEDLGNLRLESIVKIFNALGYSVVAIKDEDKIPYGSIRFDD